MNEQQNTELVANLYAAFAKGDVQTILDHCADDVEWTLEGPEVIPFAGERKGRAQVLEFFQALGGTQTNQKLTTETWVAQGDCVATLGRYSGAVKATGKAFDGPIAHFFTIRGGKVARFVNLGDTAAMVEAYTGAAAAGRG
jgi:uncharacterized protein